MGKCSGEYGSLEQKGETSMDEISKKAEEIRKAWANTGRNLDLIVQTYERRARQLASFDMEATRLYGDAWLQDIPTMETT